VKKLLQIFIAIIPLIVSFSTSDPTLAIRFLVLSIVVSGILLYYFFTNKSIYKEVIMHPALLAFGVMILAYVFSAFYNGFGSESIYVILKLFLSYIFAITLIHFIVTEGYKPMLNSFVYFSLFLSGIYIFQIINYSYFWLDGTMKSEWVKSHEFDAIAATMGHKNLLSSIQFLMLPILLYVFITAKKLFKTLSVIALVLIFITLFQTQTRAVLFALFIFSISLFLLNREKLHKKHFIGFLVGIVLLLGSGYAIMKYTNRYDAFIREINKTLEFTSSSRYKLYDSSLQLIVEHPIFGVGPGNWKIDVWEYGLYEGTLGKSFAQRPHNDFLWVFAEGGIFAGLSYILLFLILLRDSYYLHKNKEDGIFYSLLFSCFLGYGFISLVDFPMERFSHNIIFFVLASFIIAGKIKEVNTKMPTWFNLMLIGISFFAVYVASIRYQGEIHAANAIHYKSKGNWNYVIKAIDKAYNLAYYEIENTSTPLLWYRGVAYFNQQKYDLALKDFKSAYKVNPYHVHVLNNLATSYQMKGDSEKAKQYYRDVFKVNPTFKESRINLAAILYNEKKYVEALDVIIQSKIDPYLQRNNNNFQDNYDLYLKTIVKAWVGLEFINANQHEQIALNRWVLYFTNQSQHIDAISKSIFKIRQKEDIDYLSALMLFEERKR